MSSAQAGEAADVKQAALEAKAAGVGLVPSDYEVGSSAQRSANGFTVDADELYEIPVTRGRSEPIYSKGQSRRIWGELYKVIDILTSSFTSSMLVIYGYSMPQRRKAHPRRKAHTRPRLPPQQGRSRSHLGHCKFSSAS